MTIYSINAAVNIVTAIAIVALSILAYRRKVLPGYLTTVFVIAGFGWAGLYGFVLFFGNNSASLTLGRIFIRPLVTLTLGAVAATFIYWAKK